MALEVELIAYGGDFLVLAHHAAQDVNALENAALFGCDAFGHMHPQIRQSAFLVACEQREVYDGLAGLTERENLVRFCRGRQKHRLEQSEIQLGGCVLHCVPLASLDGKAKLL